VSRHNAEDPSPAALSRRLLPMQLGVGLQGFMLWVPVEKLCMTEIGFTSASVGVMAAAYAAVVPLLEVPSGILADRWSRNWLMVLSSLALAASTLVGGLSHNVGTYVVAAMLLGVFFALNSGTVDSPHWPDLSGADPRFARPAGAAARRTRGAGVPGGV
jgi:MFS family permease